MKKNVIQPTLFGFIQNYPTEVVAPHVKNTKHKFVRQYHDEYLKFGFILQTECKQNNNPRPLCVICFDILSNESMKPSKLERHLKTKHAELKNKSIEYFERKKLELQIQNSSFKTAFLSQNSISKASYLVSLQIGKSKKEYSIAEKLIKPCLVEVCSEVFGSGAADKIRSIPLSNDTIQRRMVDLSSDVEDQLIQCVKESKWFAIQLDESTDITNKAILLCYIRYIDYNMTDVKEEFMCCFELPSVTTSSEIFNAIDKYIRNIFEWKNCIGLCTDGAANMTGRHSGVAKRIKDVSDQGMIFVHCIIHREHLATKRMSVQLNEVFLKVIKIVNFIKSNALNSRLFTILCQEMGSEHEHLLLHAEVRWLSRGKVLKRLLELRLEAETLLKQKHSDLAEFFGDINWVSKLAYLSDIFLQINELNLSLQGNMSNVFILLNKVDAFKKKLKLWYRKVQENNFEMFVCFFDIINMENVDIENMKICICEHLKSLSQAFDNYYPQEEDIRAGYLWILNPFLEAQNYKLTNIEEESLLELSSDLGLKSMFGSMSLVQFWIKVKPEYPQLHEKAMRYLLPFSTTYLCEAAFSTMSLIRTKQRNRLMIEPALRIALTNLTPRIQKLVQTKEQQQSH